MIMNYNIPLFKSYWEEDDIEAIAKVIRRGSHWASGPEVEQLESNIANFVGAKHAVSFNSGTSALHADLLAHGITEGEVIVPSFTFISTANVAILSGAKPVFAEIENTSFGLDSEDVKERITNKTKAIIPVHYGGAPCKDIEALRDIAEDHNILLIEDAAESLGAQIKNKKVGSFGQSSMFSFCQNKIITAGEGGAIVSDKKDIVEKLKLIRSHGRQEKGENYFTTSQGSDYVQIGYNFRLPTISAALILSQLKKINKIINLRREKAQLFTDRLSTVKAILPPVELKDHYHVYQLYTIQCADNKERELVQQKLTEAGIMAKVYFSPVHLTTFYRNTYGYRQGDLPKTEQISKKVLTLPLYPTITTKEVEYICDTITKCCR